MHDKVVRRRRAVLALLVVVSVVLLTAYFGESASSPLHSVQRGIVAVVSPIQDGASKVLSPVRDVSDWVSSTLRAKSENAQLRRQNADLHTELATAKQQAINYNELTKQLNVDDQIGAKNYDPVNASVISRDPSLWSQQVELNAGSGDGVKLNDPVLADGALVGKVSLVTGSSCEVTLISNHTFAVVAEVQNDSGDQGVLEPEVGNPGELVLQDLPHHAAIQSGDQVVTAGFSDPSDPSQQGSLYPQGIPIGTVAGVSQNELLNSGQVTVTPLASLRRFTQAQVLTKSVTGTEEAMVP